MRGTARPLRTPAHGLTSAGRSFGRGAAVAAVAAAAAAAGAAGGSGKKS